MVARTPDYKDGQTIPGTVYRVHRALGSGGMGTVYDVEDTTVGRRYVLKTLHGDLAERADLASRLSREARALAKLQHLNIVEVYTSGTTQDQLHLPYYVMERLDGQSLRTIVSRKGRLPLEQALDLASDLLEALDHAHEHGIIHRDVKPDNIFVTRGRDGRSIAKLLDFGIAKLTQRTNTVQTAGFLGTFRYAAPEQILGREITPRTDLYSAALVLYEMVAGHGPFDDLGSEVDIGKAHVNMAPPPLSRFGPVPADLERLVATMLAKNAQDRPPNAYSVTQSLRELKQKSGAFTPDVHEKPTVAAVVSVRTNLPQQSSGADPAQTRALPPDHDNAAPTRVVPAAGTPALPVTVVVETAVPATPLMADAPQRAPQQATRYDNTKMSAAENSSQQSTLGISTLPLSQRPRALVEALAKHDARPQVAVDLNAQRPSFGQRDEVTAPSVRNAMLASRIPLVAPSDTNNETFAGQTRSSSKQTATTVAMLVALGLLLLTAVGIAIYVVKRPAVAGTTVANTGASTAPQVTAPIPITTVQDTPPTATTVSATVGTTPTATMTSQPAAHSAVSTHHTATAKVSAAPDSKPAPSATATAQKPASTDSEPHRPGSGL